MVHILCLFLRTKSLFDSVNLTSMTRPDQSAGFEETEAVAVRGFYTGFTKTDMHK